MKHFYQVAPTPSVLIDLHCLPQMVYAYGPDCFAMEHSMPRKPNVMGYPFPLGTRVVSSCLVFLNCLF